MHSAIFETAAKKDCFGRRVCTHKVSVLAKIQGLHYNARKGASGGHIGLELFYVGDLVAGAAKLDKMNQRLHILPPSTSGFAAIAITVGEGACACLNIVRHIPAGFWTREVYIYICEIVCEGE